MNGAEHIKRLNELKALRAPFEPFWREAYNYTYPLRGQKFGSDNLPAEAARSAAASIQASIYDSTIKDAVRLQVSALVSGLTPANSRWFGCEIFNIDNKEAEDWLDEAADTVWQNIHASNYDVVAFEAFIDMVVSGMGPIYITEGALGTGQPYNFQQWPLHSVYCADSTGMGLVDTVYRSYMLTAEQAVNDFGDEVSEQVTKAAEKKPDQRFEFVQAIYPRKNAKKLELPIASDHIEVKGKKVVRESGFHEMPVVVPRWQVIPDSVYSVGPVDDALPDVKTLNKVVELVLSNADLAIAGMWGAVDDGVLNPRAVKVGPRKVIPVGHKDSFFPLTSGTKFDIAVLEIDRLQKSIRKLLMADQLQPQDGPAMTATEVHIRTQLVRQLLGPMYGRLQVEFLQPLVRRCFGLALRAGALGPPPQALEGKVSVIKYTSPLAKAQKFEDVGAMERFEGGLFAIAQGVPAALDIYDLDEAIRKKANLLGVPPKLIRDEKEVKTVRETRAKAMEQAKQQEQQSKLQEKIAPQMMKGDTVNA